MYSGLCLVAVKRFPENTYFPEMLISGKGKCFHVFGCISKNFPENIFWCLFPEFVLRNEIYGKSFPAFVSEKFFPKNEIFSGNAFTQPNAA